MQAKQAQAATQIAPRRELTRRQLLGAGAGAGLTAAMLTGGGLPAGVMGRAVRAQDGAAEFHGAQPYQAPPNGHYNYFVTDNILPPSGIYGDMMHLPFGLYMWASQEWIPLIAESWGYIQTGYAAAATPGASPVASPAAGSIGEADTFQVKLRRGLVWSDGNEITSGDVVTTYNIFRM
ncbi:MAG: hypothetical protein M3440_07110, partial [Chloroflexota bacterium]|nr:hypothetical protein [Chloroflexota bacterium]